MSKSKSVDPKEIKRLEKALRDPDLKKKKKTKLAAELAALMLASEPALKARVKAHKADEKSGQASEDKVTAPDPAKDEARAAGQRHMEHLARVGELEAIVAKGKPKAAVAGAQAELDAMREATIKHARADDALDGESEGEYQWRKKALREAAEAEALGKALDETQLPGDTDAEIKARVKAKRKARESGLSESETEEIGDKGERVVVENPIAKSGETIVVEHERVVVETEEETRIIVDPEAKQPRDRWDRPLITPPGETKAVGYRRVTTYIDVLEDKSSLMDWGKRITLAGAAVNDAVIDDTRRLSETLDVTIEMIDKKLRKGKLTIEEHTATRESAIKLYTDGMRILTEAAFQSGDGRVAAETGTRIHKLTELHDLGLPMPDDVTESELRDLGAYAAACSQLNVEIKLVEQFVVVDRLKVGGTLDRLLRYDSPSLGRRVTAIGDVKTGRVDYGASKMCRQLDIYAQGKTYDFRKPEERGALRANRLVGLIFHIPAGKGICTVYEIDLKAGAEGVKICESIWAYRDKYRKMGDVFSALN